MSESPIVEEALSSAKEEEKRYEWLKATDYYRKALGFIPKADFLRRGEVSESLAYVVYKAAFQSDNSKEFRERIAEAIALYKDAMAIYAESNEAEKAPRISRCEAMVAFAGYWIVAEPSRKKKQLESSWGLTVKALDAFEGLAEHYEYGWTYNELSKSALLWEHFERDPLIREKTIEQAAEYGEKTIKSLSPGSNVRELARAYIKTAILLDDIADPDERERRSCSQKIDDYRHKASQLSERDASLEYVSTPNLWFEDKLGEENELRHLTATLELANKTRDKFIIGGAFDMLASHAYAKSFSKNDPEEIVELHRKALQNAKNAYKNFSSIAYVSCGFEVYWADEPEADYYYNLSNCETDLSKRRLLLYKALEAARDKLKKAEDSGLPRILIDSHVRFGNILRELAKTEDRFDSKKDLLEEAYSHIAESARSAEELWPFSFANRGNDLGFLVAIKSLIADLATDPEKKKSLLLEAIIDKEKSLDLILKQPLLMTGPTAGYALLGLRYHEYGELLSRLYACTGDRQSLLRSIDAFEKAVESYQKPEMASRVAECHWKVAAAYDVLGENEKAAKNFELASQDYNTAAGKIPKLKEFYLDHEFYMRAWSEIEKARHDHARQEYEAAKEHFEKASGLHASTKTWSYLASNYAAWARMEHAEQLSRKDRTGESHTAFQETAELFNKAKQSLESHLSETQDQDEKQMITTLLNASENRCEYSKTRIALEEARILDKKGDHSSSAENYRSAVEKLDKIIQNVGSEQDKRELHFIMCLSRAWQKMEEAESEATAAPYSAASLLFEQAKDYSPNEKAKMSALGHSRFCKALEAGVRFVDTRDAASHGVAKQHLESAMDYYLKADFEKALEHAKGTALLFDAYLYMSNASTESDPEKKAKLYIMTEKVLQASANAYAKADNPSKSDRVKRLLDKTREEKELALSLTEVLHAPVITSTTALPSPAPTCERATGLQRLEHAEIQANILASRSELKVGESLDLEIEIINAGNGTALLDKILEAIPESFYLKEKPTMYRVEGCSINLKGKRLDPLKAEEVKLSMRSKQRGSFTMAPRILYLDENGNTKSHQPNPVTITVKELGIRGWIKGET